MEIFAFLGTFGTPELITVVVVVLVVFGGSQIPKLARNLGRAQKEFKDGLAAGAEDSESAGAAVTEATATETDNQ